MNKKLTVAAILVAGYLTTGCGAHTANANEGMGAILGGVVGGVVGNQFGKGSGKTAATVVGSMIGVVTGANVGRSMDNKHYPHGPHGTVVPSRPPSGHGHVSNPCDVYSHPGDRAACLRGLEEREAEEKRRREREAYERGRNGGGHTHYNPSHGNHSYNNTSPFNFVFVWEKNRYRNKCGYHGRKCYKKDRRWRKVRNRCGRGYKLRRDYDGRLGCFPKR